MEGVAEMARQQGRLLRSTTPDEASLVLGNGQHAEVSFGDWNGRPRWLRVVLE
jgi:hypothetical protein